MQWRVVDRNSMLLRKYDDPKFTNPPEIVGRLPARCCLKPSGHSRAAILSGQLSPIGSRWTCPARVAVNNMIQGDVSAYKLIKNTIMLIDW